MFLDFIRFDVNILRVSKEMAEGNLGLFEGKVV